MNNNSTDVKNPQVDHVKPPVTSGDAGGRCALALCLGSSQMILETHVFPKRGSM